MYQKQDQIAQIADVEMIQVVSQEQAIEGRNSGASTHGAAKQGNGTWFERPSTGWNRRSQNHSSSPWDLNLTKNNSTDNNLSNHWLAPSGDNSSPTSNPFTPPRVPNDPVAADSWMSELKEQEQLQQLVERVQETDPWLINNSKEEIWQINQEYIDLSDEKWLSSLQEVPVKNNDFQNLFKIGFRPPEEADFQEEKLFLEWHASQQENESGNNGAEKAVEVAFTPGNITYCLPKMIHGMRICPRTHETLYLCSWEQPGLKKMDSDC